MDQAPNYYQALISRVENLIASRQFAEARTLVQAELAMPYVPLEYEKALERFNQDLERHAQMNAKAKVLSGEETLALLFSTDQASWLVAASQLETLNLHYYANEIARWFTSVGVNAVLHKAIIIELMIAQKVDVELVFNARQVINPARTSSIFALPSVAALRHALATHFFKAPAKLEAAFNVLNHYLLISYPELAEAPDSLALKLAHIVDFYFDDQAPLTSEESALLAQLN